MPACFILALTGIQTIPPDHAVVPPINSVFSITRTLRPSAAATAAAVMPPAPAPITTTSYASEAGMGAPARLRSHDRGVVGHRRGDHQEHQIDQTRIRNRVFHPGRQKDKIVLAHQMVL